MKTIMRNISYILVGVLVFLMACEPYQVEDVALPDTLDCRF